MKTTIQFKGSTYTIIDKIKTPKGICYKAINLNSVDYPKPSIIKFSTGAIVKCLN